MESFPGVCLPDHFCSIWDGAKTSKSWNNFDWLGLDGPSTISTIQGIVFRDFFRWKGEFVEQTQREIEWDRTPSAFVSFVAFTQMRLNSISVYYTNNGEIQEYIAVLLDKMNITCCPKVAEPAVVFCNRVPGFHCRTFAVRALRNDKFRRKRANVRSDAKWLLISGNLRFLKGCEVKIG